MSAEPEAIAGTGSDGWPQDALWVRDALRELRLVEVSVADGFAARVTDVVTGLSPASAVADAGERALRAGRRRALAVADWARKDRRTVGALASSAILVGALAIGLEARHAVRARRRVVAALLTEERAA